MNQKLQSSFPFAASDEAHHIPASFRVPKSIYISSFFFACVYLNICPLTELQLLTDFHKTTFEDVIKDHTTSVFLTW
jgi:hypothetical protein